MGILNYRNIDVLYKQTKGEPHYGAQCEEDG